MSAELDKLIHEKRSQLKEAFAVYQKARKATRDAQMHLARIGHSGGGTDFTRMAPRFLLDAQEEVQRLASEEHYAATRFNAISEELAQLHRGKYGEWHFTWRGSHPHP